MTGSYLQTHAFSRVVSSKPDSTLLFDGQVPNNASSSSHVGLSEVCRVNSLLANEGLVCPGMQALPKALGQKAKRHLEVLFEWAMPACLRFVRKELQELSPTEDAGLARGCMRIIESCLDDFVQGGLKSLHLATAPGLLP